PDQGALAPPPRRGLRPRRQRAPGSGGAGAGGDPRSVAGSAALGWRGQGAGVRIGEISVGHGEPLLLIAGPCVIEGEPQTLAAARRVADVSQRAGTPAVFKCSFDKANRTSHKSFRGPGLVEGLRVLARVRK